jgi:acetyl-CoA synthetase
MKETVKDRLADSGAVAIITTSNLLSRIPMEKLPDLKHVIVLDDYDNDKTS